MPAHVGLRRALAGVQAVLTSTMRLAAAEPRVTGENEGYGSGTRPLGLRLLESIDAIRQVQQRASQGPPKQGPPKPPPF